MADIERSKNVAVHNDTPEKGFTTIYASSSDEGSNNAAPFTEAETKLLLRRLDYHLLPFLSLLYLLSFLDRTNIGNARLFNMEKDLHMNPESLQYNTALAIFFPFYVLVEVPSNMMMKRFSPSLWLTFLMLSWSIIVICMGFVHNFAGLLVARAFLGLAEGGLFPGVNYYITMWYGRHECAFRMALFFSAATIAGAFGGLLARAIGVPMNGDAGRSGWSWIFIIEGAITFVVACVAYWMINDNPKTAKFLSTAEKTEIERRLKADRSSLSDDFKIKYLFDALKDWKVYIYMIMTIGTGCTVYSIALFLPTIIKVMGNDMYSASTTQLLTVPPYVLGCIVCITCGFLADRYKIRGPIVMGLLVVGIIGFILLRTSGNPTQQYVGVFFCVAGVFPTTPLSIAWIGNNMGGSLKRGVAIAMHVAAGNLGGIAASFMYISKHAPRYKSGHSALIGLLSMSLGLATFLHFWLKNENNRRDRMFKAPEAYTQEERDAEYEKGDYATYFRYTL